MGLQKFRKSILNATNNLEFLAVLVFPDSSITLDIRMSRLDIHVSIPTMLVLNFINQSRLLALLEWRYICTSRDVCPHPSNGLLLASLEDLWGKNTYFWNKHTSNIYFDFWWTFVTCVLNAPWCKLWYVQTLQLYRVCSPEWNFFMWIFRLLFCIDLLHSLHLIFSLFWWTFLTCVDKLCLYGAW